MPRLRLLPGASLVAASLLPMWACTPRIESTPALNLALPAGSDDAVWATRMLDRRARGEVLAAFASLPYGEIPPLPASEGLRWIDLDRAARDALPRAGVAIVSTRLDPPEADGTFAATRIVYELITLGDEPGRLEIERRDGPDAYAASATVGLLADRDDLAGRILAELAASMRAFASKHPPIDSLLREEPVAR